MAISPARFLFDDRLRRAANDRCENYWFMGLHEVADQMGLTADPLSREELCPGGLADVRVLILPDLPPEYLTDAERDAVSRWVHEGGLLVGLGTEGLDPLFGVEQVARFEQPEGPWSCSAALRLTDPELAHPLYSVDIMDAPLLIFSPVRVLTGAERELARLFSLEGEDLNAAAITLRQVGRGLACYFAFDLCQTVWVLHQGRPIYTDRDGDGYFRFSDAIVIRPFRPDVPYADLLVFLLRNVIALAGLSFVYPLPPTQEGQVPHALFYWGGDDEGATGIQVASSDWMHQHGLPYHINLMPSPEGVFGVSKQEYEHLKANGHEPSLHFNCIDGHAHPYAFTEQDIRQQAGWYEQAFGEKPVCSVFHWTTWHQWSEPAEWMAACGIQADNSRIHWGSPPINPVNLCGYSFGTAYPFWYRTDWRGGNRRVDFLSEQIVAYECGYIAGQGTEFGPLHRAIRDAGFWHLTTNFFHHPIYIVTYEECRQAILETIRYARELGLTVVLMGNDQLNHWWRARSATRIAEQNGDVVAHCQWPTGCVLMRRSDTGVRELGGCWEYRVVPAAGD